MARVMKGGTVNIMAWGLYQIIRSREDHGKGVGMWAEWIIKGVYYQKP